MKRRSLTNIFIIIITIVLICVMAYQNRDTIKVIVWRNSFKSVEKMEKDDTDKMTGATHPAVEPPELSASYEYVNDTPCSLDMVELPAKVHSEDKDGKIRLFDVYIKLEDYYITQEVPDDIDDIENISLHGVDYDPQSIVDRKIDDKHKFIIVTVSIRNPNDTDVKVCLTNIRISYNMSSSVFSELSYDYEKKYAKTNHDIGFCIVPAGETIECKLLYIASDEVLSEYDAYLKANFTGIAYNDGSWAAYKLDLSKWME